jgi:putative ATP-dependent endonuclease of the OLD family
VLDAVGKYEIPRFMTLLGAFKIKHIVLHDMDSTKKHTELNQLIQDCRNESTGGIEILDKNLEDVLGYKLPTDRWKKASALLLAVQDGKIKKETLNALIERLDRLINVSSEHEEPVSASEGSSRRT